MAVGAWAFVYILNQAYFLAIFPKTQAEIFQNSSRNVPKLKQNFQETQGIFGQNSRIFSKLNISANFVSIHNTEK